MSAEVHLHVRPEGSDEERLAALRQSLATCLASGVREVRVHVAPQEDVGLPVLRALHAAAQVLARRGGALRLVGGGERTGTRVRVHGLDDLLPVVEPYPQSEAARGAHTRGR